MPTNKLAVAVTGLLLWLLSGAAPAEPLPVPGPEQYANFLMEPWKPDAPSLLVFKDPFCPYCISAFEKRERLSRYNVYVFWFPIFGERSDRRVEEIFRCNSPLSRQVIDAVIARAAPGCTGEEKRHLRELNDAMVLAYQPDAVPSYYMGGRRLSLAELDQMAQVVTRLSGTVVLDWRRYAGHRLALDNHEVAKVAVVVPERFDDWDALLGKLRQHSEFQWYVFIQHGSPESYRRLCQQLQSGCEAGKLERLEQTAAEVDLLFGLELLEEPRYVLNGKLLTPSERQQLLAF